MAKEMNILISDAVGRGNNGKKRCSYDVPRMILLCNVKEAMRLDHSKDMFVHVSTCTSYDFNALTPVVWKVRP
jgi:hypothetical protein